MRQKLLIAESDSNLRAACEQFFTEYGFDVETASDGISCVKKLSQMTPDLLVMDMDLNWGGADGVLDHLHDEYPKRDIPVILTEATEYPQEFAKIVEPPVVACIPKPFRLAKLLERIDTTLNEKRRNRLPYLNRVLEHSELFVG